MQSLAVSVADLHMLCCHDDAERPPETAKEKAAREAREKKEKAQELIRKREAEEAAQNLGNCCSSLLSHLLTFVLLEPSAFTFVLQSG